MKISLLILCVASVCTTTLHAENLLKNASFEDAGSSPDTAANWYRWGDWINRETAWNPTHSGQCLIGYHHWEITKPDNSGLWQDVTTVKAGQKFKFSIFASADVPQSGSPADKVELRLEAIRDGHEVMIQSVNTSVADLQKEAGWHELSVTGTTPENNIRVLVVVTPASGSRGGSVKFDDANLELAK